MLLGQRGPAPGKLSEDTFNVLVQAFGSCSWLYQINQVGHLNTHVGYLEEVVQDVVHPATISQSHHSASAFETNDN